MGFTADSSYSGSAGAPRPSGRKLRATFVFLSARDLGKGAKEKNPVVPSHVYYGMREVAALGFETEAVFPNPRPSRLVRWCSSAISRVVGCPVYFGGLGRLARTLGPDEVIVNTTMMHGLAWSILRLTGRARAPQVMISVGHEYLADRHPIRGRLRRSLLRLMLTKIEAIVTFCPLEVRHLQTVLRPKHTWMGAIPQGIDLTFSPDAIDAEDSPPYIASIGADAQRDFKAMAEIARRMPQQRFVVVSTAKILRGIEFPANVRVHTEMPQAEAREIFRRASALLITTRPSSYISGLTTILISSAMGKPVIFDNAPKGAVYGLTSWKNCVTFQRGDIAGAADALTKLMADTPLRHAIGRRAQEFAREHPIAQWAERLAVVIEGAAGHRTLPPTLWPRPVPEPAQSS